MTLSTAAKKKPPPCRTFTLASAAMGLLLAGVILLTGTLLAGGLKQKGGELLVKQVFQSNGEQLRGAENKLTQKKTISLLKEYTFALIDATISFETVPKLNTREFYSVVTAMPEGVEVTGVSFQGYDLLLECHAERAEEQALFVQRLEHGGQFREVKVANAPQSEEGFAFRLTCVPTLEQGELQFDQIPTD